MVLNELRRQRANSQTCLDKLLKCKTADETKSALLEIQHLLTVANDPVADAVTTALQQSIGMDDAFVLRVRDEFISHFRSFLSATESGVSDLEALESGRQAESKPKRRVWLYIALGVVAVCICLVFALALAGHLISLGSP